MGLFEHMIPQNPMVHDHPSIQKDHNMALNALNGLYTFVNLISRSENGVCGDLSPMKCQVDSSYAAMSWFYG